MPRKVVNAIIILIVLIVIYNLIGQIITTLRSGDRLEQAISSLHSLETRNKELKERLNLVKSAEFLEQQARDNLGLVQPGETVIIIPEYKLQSILGATQEAIEPRLPNWQGWLRLFFR